MDIAFSGLGSGLDTQALIGALLSLEQRPITLLENQRSSFENKKKLFNEMDGLLETLENKAKSLNTDNKFLALSATAAEEGYYTASANGSAQTAFHEIEVQTLAQTGRLGTIGYADSDTTTHGTGTIQIDVGGTITNVTIDSSNNTLSGIVGAINNADAGVNASIIDDGGTDPYHIVIETEETGLDEAALSVNFGTTTLTTDAAFDQTAGDASVIINGITILRPTNEVEDAIQGVTLNLLKEHDSGETTRLDIAVDRAKIKGKIEDFVDAYNDIIDFINKQSKYDETAKSSGPLAGDSTMRSIQQELFSDITSQRSDTGLQFRSLADIGVQLEDDGKLEIDNDVFDDALEGDLEDMAGVFTDSSEGVANILGDTLDVFTDSIDGLIKVRTDGIDDRVKNINRSIDAAELRLEQYEQTLVSKFAAFETLMGSLNAQGQYLGSAFG